MKGQFSLVTLIFVVIILVVFGALLPTLNSFISTVLPSADAPTAALLQMMPAIILVLIIGGLFIRGSPTA